MQFDRITITPVMLNGKPCIRGRRFPVYQIIDLVAAGNNFEQIISDYPYVDREDIRQALAYADYLTREDQYN